MTPERITLGSDSEESAAVAAVVRHHGAMTARVAELAGGVVDAVTDGADVSGAKTALVSYMRDEVLPHALAEESTLYRAAAEEDRARMLIDAMIAEHALIFVLIDCLDGAQEPGPVAAAAGAVEALFVAHVRKENDLIVPLLASLPDVSLAGLVRGLHELVGEDDAAATGGDAGDGGAGDGCGCDKD
ncbi:MAG: hemerythrin domain-containing protein [Candidatus Nanopelagicales bacterium]|nr:hemerythrin domain-containing protein [Candidatus Nanopelagicales bacterium]MDZ4250117.1 hemerythrin domain-containing protein [Candidatus Nanopelagicales bacterium]